MTGPPVSRPPRPAVSVVMPFAGDAAAAAAAVRALGDLRLRDEDERILVHNGGARPSPADPAIRVVPAPGEASPAHARNVGAAQATRPWLLFIDADCVPVPDLADRYFEPPPGPRDGALAGGVLAAPGARSLAARYGAARSFLDQGAHLAHPYLPRAVAANLLVRREAFAAIGGFLEGLRAAEDTDFSWRLQRAGWRLDARPRAEVRHVYRRTVRALRAQWRGYAAGRAWLGRRYVDFAPEPAVRRAVRRLRSRAAAPRPAPRPAPSPEGRAPRPAPRRDRALFAVLDAVLGIEELVGLSLSNRPARERLPAATVVLIAERYPAAGDPFAELAGAIAGARIEASARPERLAPGRPGDPPVRYREDDGRLARRLALLALLARHPLRCLRDRVARSRRGGSGGPSLAELAPVVARLRGDDDAPLRALGPGPARPIAGRLARLSGRRLEP